ncbi:aldo/keto reductase [Blastococcus sp. CT_GayMR16]|nr:aldo/keto reductase [Blastococcus sp. CT_GayMR16]
MDARTLDDTTVGTVSLGDRTVGRLGFGAMRVSSARNAEGKRDRAEAVRLCRRAYERGVRFFDTADIYGLGESEEIIAEALHPYPDDLVIGTKAGFRPARMDPGHATMPPSGRPENIRVQAEKSLTALRLDCLPVYQVHVPDPSVPYADTLGAFADLQQEGKVAHIGVCNVSEAQLELARSMFPVVSVQNRYNASDRAFESVLAACEAAGIPFLPWQPIAVQPNLAGRTVAEVAAEMGVLPQQVALAWLFRRSPLMLPIPGTSKVAHLDDNIDGAWVSLSDEDYGRIDRAAAL